MMVKSYPSVLENLDALTHSQGPSSSQHPISRYEITPVYTSPSAQVDIILVHGLNGSPDKTWTSKNGTFWPADLLPKSLASTPANILVYGYNADVYSRRNDRSASDNFIHQHAQTLVTSLTLYRRSEGTFKNPIIWICHSLGGILVKRALLYSNDVHGSFHDPYRSIYVSTYGLIFLGTPHTGADAAGWGLMLQAMSDVIIPRKFFESEGVLLRTLKKDNETLANINNHFLDIYQRFRIHMVHENCKTDIKGSKVIVVDAVSASPQLPGVTYYGIEATHTNMCKFDSVHAPGYRLISTEIREWARDAPAVVNMRWQMEEEEMANRMRHEIQERMSPYVSCEEWKGSSVGWYDSAAAAALTVGCFGKLSHHFQQQVLLPAAVMGKSTSTLELPRQMLGSRQERPRSEGFTVQELDGLRTVVHELPRYKYN